MTLDMYDREVIAVKAVIRALDGPIKVSTIRNHIDSRASAKESREILDHLARCGYLTSEKVHQVYVYTITDQGRAYANDEDVRRLVE